MTFENRSVGAVLFIYGSVLLVAAFIIAVGVFLIFLALKDDLYNKIISQVSALGNTESIGKLLKNTKKNRFAVGNLYCPGQVLFYYCSCGGFAIKPLNITSLYGADVIKKSRHLYYTEFFVDIVLNEGANERIYVKQKNMLPLIDYLTELYGIENRN